MNRCCPRCGIGFTPLFGQQKYCSKQCGDRFRQSGRQPKLHDAHVTAWKNRQRKRLERDLYNEKNKDKRREDSRKRMAAKRQDPEWTKRLNEQAKAYKARNPGKRRESRHREKQRLWEFGKRKPRLHSAHVAAWHKHVKHVHRLEQQLHDQHVKDFKRSPARRERYKCAVDVGYRLNRRIRVAVRKAMRGGKAGRSWEKLLGYTLAELQSHLARMLPAGLSLKQCIDAGWHIDHIVPKIAFDLSCDEGLRAAWHMANLRLVPAHVNLKKNARREFLC